MIDSEYKKKLQDYYDEITKGIYSKDLKHYNLRSIKNFIIHFDKLFEEDKSEAYQRINSYLDLVKESNSIEVRKNTVEMYNEIIYPIASDYYFRLGFAPYARWVVIYAMLAIILLILFLVEASLIWYTIVLLAFIAHHCWVLQKKLSNKVFGLRY